MQDAVPVHLDTREHLPACSLGEQFVGLRPWERSGGVQAREGVGSEGLMDHLALTPGVVIYCLTLAAAHQSLVPDTVVILEPAPALV